MSPPCTIRIAADEMDAWLDFHTDAPCSVETLQTLLGAAGVTHGIDMFLLQDLAAAHHPGRSYCIAQGTPATAALQYSFQRTQNLSPKRLPDGQVDFYNLGTIPNVGQHQVLVARVPVQERHVGTTVTGKTVPPSEVDEALPTPGPNVTLSADGNALLALTHGYPVLIDDVLRVDSTYTLEGNVDFSVGNVACVADLAIMGDVQSGFHVQCAQQLTTYGVVEQSTLNAGGSITLYGNVFGQRKAQITSGASIYGAYINAASVIARQDIVLRQGARHSHLQAGGSITVQSETGHLLGGSALAFDRIVTHNMGSASRVPTHVEILPSIYDEDQAPILLDHLQTMLRDDAQLLEHKHGAPDTPTAQLAAFRATLHQCQVAATQLSTYLQGRRQFFAAAPQSHGIIIATGTVYPGVRVCIGGASLEITQPLANVMFYKAGQTIQSQVYA